MATEKVMNLVEEVKGLTVLELSELVKALEEEFGVSAAAPVAMMAGPAAGAAPAELKAEWDAAGVDEYVNVKSNCLAILTAIQKERGIC